MRTDSTIFYTLISNVLKAGYVISLFDGQEYVVKRSSNIGDLVLAANSTGEDRLKIRDSKGDYAGDIVLVWGNEDETLIADWVTAKGHEQLEEIICKVALV